MELTEITNTFGNYPHSYSEIVQNPDPTGRYYMLRNNLVYSLQYRPRQQMRHTGSEARLRKLAQNGWQIDASFRINRSILLIVLLAIFFFPAAIIVMLRPVTGYMLSRPAVTHEELSLLGWR